MVDHRVRKNDQISISSLCKNVPYLYDVRTKGEGEGWPKRNNSADRLREWDRDKGGGGPMIRYTFRRHLRPLNRRFPQVLVYCGRISVTNVS